MHPDEGVRWRVEAAVAVVVVAYSVVLGGAAGLLWQRTATSIALAAAVNGSEAAFKALLDDDMQLALIGAGAGVVVVLLAFVAGRGATRGPGAAVGIAVGGLLGSLVAAHVGLHARHGGFPGAARSAVPGITPHSLAVVRGYFGFRVRMKAVLLAWPVAAVAVFGASSLIAVRRRRPRDG